MFLFNVRLKISFRREVNILNSNIKEIIQVSNDNNTVGLDFSMKELFVTSKNQRADYPSRAYP